MVATSTGGGGVGGGDGNRVVGTITLEDNGDAPFHGKGLKVLQGSIVRFIIPIGSSILTEAATAVGGGSLSASSLLSSSTPELFTNYPLLLPDSPFDRNQYHRVTSVLTKNGATTGKSGDWIVELEVAVSGCFSYYIQITSATGVTKRSKEGHLYADPVITINNTVVLPPEAITLQTVLPKCLGSYEQWEEKLVFTAVSGYNMVHFTPVQELGTSQSSYSIYHQLMLNSKLFPSDSSEEQKWTMLSDFVSKLENKYNMLSMTDVVWNHTADNSPWLLEHPEAGYNLDNSPHLKSAFALDEAILQFSKSVEGTSINDENDLNQIMAQLSSAVFSNAKLWEYFVVDVEAHVKAFREAINSSSQVNGKRPSHRSFEESVRLLREQGLHSTGDGERYHMCVKLDTALTLFNVGSDNSSSGVDTKCKNYENALRVLNIDLYRKYDIGVGEAMRNMTERIRYEFVSYHGPRFGTVSAKHPLLSSLFTRINVGGKVIPLANNGWIYNGNPLVDFAGPQSNTYFNRDLIVWGDCVKLRYGKGPSDSPWLWQHMTEYTTKMAKIFHAFRIDNCHSTPIHVAQHLLDAARRVRNNLYVVCELFTGSEEIDALYVSQLGITSLIREAMGANDSWELGRLCHRHGGNPVGSFSPVSPAKLQHKVLHPSLPGALFMDCTHDNETPAQKRTPQDCLPNAAVVAMAVSAVGSVRGYDELFPRTVDVVHETRTYPLIKDLSEPGSGIAPVKFYLNAIHERIAKEGYSEIHVHQEGNIIAIQRHRPATHEAVYVVVHSAFSYDNSPWHPVRVPGVITEYIFFASLSNIRNPQDQVPPPDPRFLYGLSANLNFVMDGDVNDYLEVISGKDNEDYQEIRFFNFPPGSVLAFKVALPQGAGGAIQDLHALLIDDQPLESALEGCGLVDLNVLLYRHSVEEHIIIGTGAYDIPHYGTLFYCGLQGFASVLSVIQDENNLGHPMCGNLRDGNWMMEYIVSRLRQRPNLAAIAAWFHRRFFYIQQLPRYLIPMYFAQVVLGATRAAEHRALRLMSPFVRNGSSFIKDLALTSVQLYGIVDSVLISHENILPPVPDNKATLAAGLPHFATGYMRSWGRDTFISLKGLFLVTGRFTEARLLILAYAACVRHGLVPNLLDSGHRPRYNARDAVWWFLQGVQDYCSMAPEGIHFLKEPVARLFTQDKREVSTCTMAELIQEIMQRHATGISFREWNAGRDIDDRMQDKGFNVVIQLNKNNGFLYGGNEYNCGTWMDKMGESSKAGNRGIPATPRDGAPIEITGLLKSCVRWLAHLHRTSPPHFPFEGVALFDSMLSYAEWDSLIQANFDAYYYVPEDPADDDKYHIAKTNVNRRGIYKDVVGSPVEHMWADYQLRPNQCVAMAVAPELFPSHHAQNALRMIESVLVKGAPLGVRTLDPTDYKYRGNYEQQDSDDYTTAGGFSYHNGPEWVWPLGYFLRAKLHFHPSVLPAPSPALRHYIDGRIGNGKTPSTPVVESMETPDQMVHKFLRHHRTYIAMSHFRGLPELTNKDGAFCSGSCDVQAWSSATILDALHHLHLLE